MTHKCTWRGCGAPATKKVHLRLKNPFYQQLHEDGSLTKEKSEGRDLWRCDVHYKSCIAAYTNSVLFEMDL